MDEIVFQRGTLTQEAKPVTKAVQKYDSYTSVNKLSERDKKAARELAAILLGYKHDYAIGLELLKGLHCFTATGQWMIINEWRLINKILDERSAHLNTVVPDWVVDRLARAIEVEFYMFSQEDDF